MAKPNQEAIETFMSITGVPESVALRKIEEHGGNLNEAVNSHFNEGDRNTVNTGSFTAPQDDAMDIDDPAQNESWAPPSSLLSADRPTLNPFSLLDDSFSRRFFDRSSDFGNQAPSVSHPRQVREIPIEVKDGDGPTGSVERGPTIEDVTGREDDQGPTIHGTVTIDDDDDIPAVSSAQQSERTEYAPGVGSQNRYVSPSAPEFNSSADYNDVEEAMIRAAIEASKKDIAGTDNELDDSDSQNEQSAFKDTELAHAASLSLEAAEREKRLQGQKFDNQVQEDVPVNPSEVEPGKASLSNGRFEVGTSSLQDEVEEVEQPLIRRRSRRTSPRSVQPVQENNDPPTAELNDTHDPGHNENSFHSDEWGGISSLEHDEAVMLEAAMFGGIPEGSGYHFPYAPHQLMHGEGLYPRQAPRPPSPSLEAQRLIREQQDDEYLASLQADQEKELRAKAEAEARHLEEAAARQAALEEERRKEEECLRKMEEEQEFERQLAAIEASLPQEPAADDENAVTLLVKMPDGSRRGRRFLKADKLRSLFDFIDIGRGVKPGTYRLVRPYPRRAFSNGESSLALNELGLTSKQEALFLEFI